MGENIVGLFNSEHDAQAAAGELLSRGFDEAQVSVIAKNPRAAVEAIELREAQTMAATQPDAGVEMPQAQMTAAQPGGVYMIVRARSQDEVQQAIDLMHRYNVADIEHREQEYQEGNWAHLDETTTAELDATQMRSRGV